MTGIIRRVTVPICMLVLMAAAYTANAQPRSSAGRGDDEEKSQQQILFGYHAALHYGIHSSRFGLIPHAGLAEGDSALFDIRSGTGWGGSAGIALDVPFDDPSLLSMRLGYVYRTAELSGQGILPVVFEGVPGDGILENRVEGKFGHLLFQVLWGYRINDYMRFDIGGEANFLLHSYVRQVEEIIEPAGGRFVDTDSPRRLVYEGRFDSATSVYASIVAGIQLLPSGSLELAGLRVMPELRISLPLTGLWNTGEWNLHSLRFGLAVMNPPPPPELPPVDTSAVEDLPDRRPPVVSTPRATTQYDTLAVRRDTVIRSVSEIEGDPLTLDTTRYERDTRRENGRTVIVIQPIETWVLRLPAIKPLLVAGVGASFVLENDSLSNQAKVTLEEFVMNRHVPPLNYVFFDEGQARLPGRYRQLDDEQARSFTVETFYSKSTLGLYNNILNVIGERMRRNPDASITLNGYNAGAGAEKGDTALSRRRAETIRDYLSSVWRIDRARVRVGAANLPPKPSALETSEGRDENRRVEIISDDPAIFEPVLLSDTVRIIDPPTIRFRTSVVSDAGIESWRLEVSQSGQLLKDIRGLGEVPADVDWRIRDDILRPLADEPLRYRLHIRDSTGQEFSTSTDAVIQFEQRTLSRKRRERLGDKLIDRFSLILFDFDQDRVSSEHERVLSIIRERITPESRIKVTGSTDRVGERQYNLDLSLRRARSIAQALGLPPENAEGVGEDEITFDNDLPEGRFYSRTVRVLIETPIR